MKENRPHAVLNFAISADGKISSVHRGPLRFSSRDDRNRMDALRAQSDAVLIGAGTLRAEDPPMRIRRRSRRDARRAQGKPAHPLSIVISRRLDFPLDGRWFGEAGPARLVVTTEGAPAHRIDRVRDHAEVVRMGRDAVDIRRLCTALKRRGVNRLLVEGGGEVNRAFFAAECVDEVYMTVCPLILGGRDAPTPVDGAGFGPVSFPALELIDHHRAGDELFLHYRVAGTREIRKIYASKRRTP